MIKQKRLRVRQERWEKMVFGFVLVSCLVPSLRKKVPKLFRVGRVETGE